jgi:hypothetical protein
MNERIDILFGQALDEAVPETWTTLNANQLDRLKEKFAELIVQECVGIADQSNVTGKSIVGERIKEHFGVEE